MTLLLRRLWRITNIYSWRCKTEQQLLTSQPQTGLCLCSTLFLPGWIKTSKKKNRNQQIWTRTRKLKWREKREGEWHTPSIVRWKLKREWMNSWRLASTKWCSSMTSCQLWCTLTLRTAVISFTMLGWLLSSPRTLSWKWPFLTTLTSL